MRNRPEYIQRQARERLMRETSGEQEEGEEPDAKKKRVIVPDSDALSFKSVFPPITSPSLVQQPKSRPLLPRLQPVTDFRKKEPPPPRRETRGLTHTDGPAASYTRLGKCLLLFLTVTNQYVHVVVQM